MNFFAALRQDLQSDLMPCLGMESHGCALLFLLLSICTPAFAALVFTSDCNAVVGDVNLFYTPMASVLSGTTEVELDDTAVRGTGSFPSDDVSNLYLFLQVSNSFQNTCAITPHSCLPTPGARWRVRSFQFSRIWRAELCWFWLDKCWECVRLLGWRLSFNVLSKVLFRGVYEFVVASASTSGGVRTLTLETALRNAYYLSAKSDTKGKRGGIRRICFSTHHSAGQARYQVIRVLACEDIALDGDVQGTRWNGLNGGVTAIVANNELNFNGHDILAPPGFRGGGLVSNPTGFRLARCWCSRLGICYDALIVLLFYSTTVPSQFALTIYGADEKWDGVKGEGQTGRRYVLIE